MKNKIYIDGRGEQVQEYRDGIPPKYRKLYDRVMSGAASPREAIKLHCLDCWGYARREAEECCGFKCALYLYRPYQKLVKSVTGPVQRTSSDELSAEGSQA